MAIADPSPAMMSGEENVRKVTTASNSTASAALAAAAADASADYRVAVFGAGGVGKSSIVLRFVKGTFSDNYVPTIEDKYDQVITCNQKSVCTLQVTDTTGSHQFPAMQRLSISKGHAFLLVYSITSIQSFVELRPIWEMIKEVKGDQLHDFPVMLVGNKKDEDSKRQIKATVGQEQAQLWGVGFIETSAKSNENITELFQKLLSMEKKRHLALTANDEDAKNGTRRRCVLM
ncbi:unnamed protein product [Bursaphelenchus xylophilus]|uniref:(pine wood nematode) hypothetical protein n=1 Tax=Bursaphelenchus xylophilus TaxID=6326 RepID=A0A1I7SWR0_BURXY|nr:unnamed protein product [Bursaphelenchus xylophilus]CAG9099821.1 unnamed protein product [Bursaphelenchus xylophilus]